MGIYESIGSNKFKSWLLVTLFVVFLGLLVYLFSCLTGFGAFAAPLAFAIVLIATYGTYRYADRIVLMQSHARPASEREHAFLKNSVEGLAIAAGIPTPRIYVIEDTAPNAFATGRDPKHAIIVVTTGLLSKLERLELEGVIAHELSHIKNYDTRLMMLTAVMAGFAVLLADWMLRSFLWGGSRDSNRSSGKLGVALVVLGLLFAVLTPIVAQLIKLAISRKREFLADASGAMLTRYPDGLASALEKIDKDKEPLEAANKATAHLYIANPLKGQKLWLKSLFSTHPPIEERVKALRAM